MSGRILRTAGGRSVKLGRALGEGGEGKVLVLSGGKEVAKLYWPHKRSPVQRRKIELMVSHPPRDPMKGLGALSLAWPSDVLLDGRGAFAGFLMPLLDIRRCRPLHQVYRPSSYPRGIDWEMLVRTARNLASVVAALHREGYVVGDLNESNVLAATDTVVTLVDCDSMQVPDPSRRTVYRCVVGKPEYTPPELLGKDFSTVDRAPSADLFALAALICQLMIRGRHPFSGGPAATIGANIQAGETFFVNGFASAPGDMPPPGILPPAVHRLFERAFVDGRRDPDRRPGAEEWKQALDGLLARMRGCSRYAAHQYSAHLVSCPWCAFETRAGRSAFPAKRPKPIPSATANSGGTTGPVLPRRPRAQAPAWSWTGPAQVGYPASLVHRIATRLLAHTIRKLRSAAIGCILVCLCSVLLLFALPLLLESPGVAPVASAGAGGRQPGSAAPSPPPGGPGAPPSPSDPFEMVRTRRDRPEAWASLEAALADRGDDDLAVGAGELSMLLSRDLSSVIDWKRRGEVMTVLEQVNPGDDEWIGDEGDRARAEGREESAQALYHVAHLLDPDDREWLRKIEPRTGLQVERGIDWKDAYGAQDGGSDEVGVVIAVPPETRPGWVKVDWAGLDEENWYRWGADQQFELALAHQSDEGL